MKENRLGLPTILFLIFLILKLCKVINWSWLWVFSPLWIALIIYFIIFFIFYIKLK